MPAAQKTRTPTPRLPALPVVSPKLDPAVEAALAAQCKWTKRLNTVKKKLEEAMDERQKVQCDRRALEQELQSNVDESTCIVQAIADSATSPQQLSAACAKVRACIKDGPGGAKAPGASQGGAKGTHRSTAAPPFPVQLPSIVAPEKVQQIADLWQKRWCTERQIVEFDAKEQSLESHMRLLQDMCKVGKYALSAAERTTALAPVVVTPKSTSLPMLPASRALADERFRKAAQ